ncbi:nuclear transport factor 2 family protein [Nocardioides marmorisolisilvae]|uniref:SnoaL-like domain-containing protein n=1 Tax=Nocardioides marmorisolisilvae TaxID=1542737 RepID=A0A3N0DVJ2_9ACTN|nr:nuclear transport factor 2 family protein [Nocardioides marmorisolisilvae]RNL79635.1 hypothetical protein EFL95_11750 [Nocardioides marmorisolisilvae]
MTDSVAHRYVAAINAQAADDLMALFADDAVLLHPVGQFEGKDAIGGFYRDIVFLGQARTEIVNHYALDGVEIAVLEATSPLDPNARSVHAADVFALNTAGTITQLEIFYR